MERERETERKGERKIEQKRERNRDRQRETQNNHVSLRTDNSKTPMWRDCPQFKTEIF